MKSDSIQRVKEVFADVTRQIEGHDHHCCGCRCDGGDVTALAVVAIVNGRPEVWSFRDADTTAVVEALDVAHKALA